MNNKSGLYFIGVLSFLLCFLAVLIWVSLFSYSAVPITAQQSLLAVFYPNHNVIAHIIVQEIRLPRVLEAALVGASLACAGLLMQALTRNPLASPSLFGVNAGAALGVAIASTFLASTLPVTSPIAAILGGLTAWLFVMLLGRSWKMGSERGQLILAGIAVSALCGALTKACVILVEDQASAVMIWLAGSFASVDWNTWNISWPILTPALIVAWLITPKLNLLSMGDERVQSLGVNLNMLRALIGAVVLVLVGLSVSMVGSIAFVGLIVPHMARALVGFDHRDTLPICLLLGALLTVCADIVSRAIIFPTETPAGAILALIGAPFFLYLVRKKQ